MILRRIVLLGLVGLSMTLELALPQVDAGGDEWVGCEVMPKATCAPKIEDRDFPLKLLTVPLKVGEVRGDWLWVGRAWVRKRDVVVMKDAGTYYTEYLRKSPQSSWAHASRGAVFARTGQTNAARQDFDTAQQLDPSNPTADPTNVLEKFGIGRNGELPTIPVTIGGREYQFVVDTGCSWCVVDDTLKSQLVSTNKTVRINHRQNFDAYELPEAYIGASRLKVGGMAVCADLAEFRKWTGQNIRGMIGMSFLKACVMHIDFDAGVLAILKRVPDSMSGAIDISFPWGDLPTIDINLPTNESMRFQIDSGMARYSQIDMKTFASLVDEGHVVVVEDSGNFQTIHGKEKKRQGIIASLPVGRFKPEYIECNDGNSNVLGLNALSRFAVTFDFPNGRLYLQQGKQFCQQPRFDMSGLALSRIGTMTTIEWVYDDSPAIAAGVKDGDQLVCFDGKKSEQFSLSELKQPLSVDGRCVQLVVRRNGKLHPIAFRLSDWQKMGAKLRGWGGVNASARKSAVETAEHRGEKVCSGGEHETFSDAGESLTSENPIRVATADGVTPTGRQVAATVNGKPIFAEDILRQMPFEQIDALAKIEAVAQPDDFRTTRRQIIKIHLQNHIERELLLQELASKLNEVQLKNIEQQLDVIFKNAQLPHLMKQAGVETEAEFEAALQKRGSTMEALRSQFRVRELGQEYLASKCSPKSGFDPPDVLKYYQEHKEDYAIPPSTYQPFETVQDDIKTHLRNLLWRQSCRALIKELRVKATIETFVDEL